jgi:predicted CXXCH cytochrome family protein
MRAVTCTSCHNPHLADRNDAGANSLIVDPTHTTRKWDVGWRPATADGTQGSINAWCGTCHVAPRTERPVAEGRTVPFPIRLSFDQTLDGDGNRHDKFTFEEWTRSSVHGPRGAQLACTACHDVHGSTNAYLLRERVISPDGTSTGTMTGFGAVQAHWDKLQTFCLTCHADTPVEHGRGVLCTRCHFHTSGRL